MSDKDYTNNQDPQVKARRETLDELSDLDQELFKMSDDLKNCPFCDGEAKLDHNGDYSWAYCTKCDAMTQPEISEDDARDKWNSRVEDVAIKLTKLVQDAYLEGLKESRYDSLDFTGSQLWDMSTTKLELATIEDLKDE